MTRDSNAGARVAELVLRPRRAAIVSGVLVLVAVAIQVFALESVSVPLIGVAIVCAVICAAAAWNASVFSSVAIARIQKFAASGGGRFTAWLSGTRGYDGIAFAHGVGHERFGVLDYVDQGITVEMGHLTSEVSDRLRAPTGRRHAYVVLQLPQRLPHMIIDFGNLSKILGVRIVPEQWHRSQLLDVAGGRRFRLFVADGGEQLARGFFTPEMVRVFRRIGHVYDIEIRGRHLYLSNHRSVASGGDERWRRQRELIDELVTSVAASQIWQGLGDHPSRVPATALRADVKRGVVIVFSFVTVVVAVISAVVINWAGILG